MTRTTPPRPVDIAALFPELREHSGAATRLHPRPGAPTAADSSIGGPLRWPADEPWPTCADGANHFVISLHRLEDIRRRQQIYRAASGRSYTEQESAELSTLDDEQPETLLRARSSTEPSSR
jgi:hypothetical protein